MESPKVVVSSSPGKIILFGEHAVVYGKTALSTSLDLRTYLKLESTKEEILEVKIPPSDHFPSSFTWNLDDLGKFDFKTLPPLEDPGCEIQPNLKNFVENLCSGEGYSVFRSAMQAFLILYILIARERKSGLIVTIRTQVPVGVGLGSSAAFNTSMAAGLLKFFSYPIGDDSNGNIHENGKKIINKYAYIGEKVIHGNASGVDNTTTTYGGMVAYTAGQFQILTDIPAIKLIVTSTKVSRNTKPLVQKVGSLHKMFPQVIVPLLDSIHNISQHVIKIIKEYSLNKSDEALLEVESQLEIFISICHNIMCALGVGHPSLDKICQISSQNYMQSKMTGAGGGGCAFTLIKKNVSPSKVSKMVSQLEEAGFECFSVNIGGEGVKIHPEKVIPEWN